MAGGSLNHDGLPTHSAPSEPQQLIHSCTREISLHEYPSEPETLAYAEKKKRPDTEALPSMEQDLSQGVVRGLGEG